MNKAWWSDLYGDEDDVGEDSRQRCVSQYVAGVDDTHDEDDRHTHHKRGKDDSFKQLVSIARQDINQLDANVRNTVKHSMLRWQEANASFSIR